MPDDRVRQGTTAAHQMVVFLFFLLFVLLLLALQEYAIIRRSVRQVRNRIHVNGTRGKSTVTRLIAAGLRAGGYRVVAKTTGAVPRLILEDGSELPIRRRGRATIREQMRAIRLAARRKVDAVVLECMAVHPELQWVSEHRIFRSTVGVITNVRNDHMEVFGQSKDAMARALALTIPHRGLLVTGEQEYGDLIAQRAARLGSRIVQVAPGGPVGEVLPAAPHVFSENYQIALAVCEELGVDRCLALRGMLVAAQDEGALRIHLSRLNGKPVTFVNAFSVNDVDSLTLAWKRIIGHPKVAAPVFAILHSRDDRPLRSCAFGGAVVETLRPARLVLVGKGWRHVKREAVRRAYPAERILALPRLSSGNLGADLLPHLGGASTVVGLGNYCGLGAQIAAWFTERGSHVC